MVLVQKSPFFQLVFLGNRDQENVFYDILERKNAFLSYKNKKFKKSKNWHFSLGVKQWFWSKTGHFSNVFFSFKKLKNWHFPNGLPIVLVQKLRFFQLFFFSQYRPEKSILRYSRRKKRLSKLFFRPNRPGKCLLRYSRTKKSPSRLWKHEFQNIEKLTFF